MSAIIQKITLTLDIAEEFEGRRTVTFDVDVTSQDDPLVVAVRAAWQAHHDAELAKLRASGTPSDPTIVL